VCSLFQYFGGFERAMIISAFFVDGISKKKPLDVSIFIMDFGTA